MDYSDYSVAAVEDIARLRRRLELSGLPARVADCNLLIGTWNIRSFGRVHGNWAENPHSPKRNLRAMASIAEIVRRLDVVAIQEVKRDTTAIHLLVDRFLGPHWGLVFSDVTAGSEGNAERLAFLYDRRRVQPTGLAGEITLPPTQAGDPVDQFDRTPYIVGFRAGRERFALLTAHIRYGDIPADRLPELRALASYAAAEIRDRAKTHDDEHNLIVLGDFNIDQRGDNPLFQTFVATGLVVPRQLLGQKTTFGTDAKYYDHIAWFMGNLDMVFSGNAGVIDFGEAIYKELTLRQMSYRVSDHFPLWAEFLIDRSTEAMAKVLGVNPDIPDPLSIVPD